MKKRYLTTFALVTTMAVGSVFGAFASDSPATDKGDTEIESTTVPSPGTDKGDTEVESPSDSEVESPSDSEAGSEVEEAEEITADDWWVAWSKSYEIADGYTTEFKLTVKGGDAFYQNVCAVFTNSEISGTVAPATEAGASYTEYAVVRGDNYGRGSTTNLTFEGGIADLGADDFIATMKDCSLNVKISRSGNDIVMVTKATGANGKEYTRTAKFSDDLAENVYVFFVPDTATITVSYVGKTEYEPAEDPTTSKIEDPTTVKNPSPSTGDNKGEDNKGGENPTSGEEPTVADPITNTTAQTISEEEIAAIATEAAVEATGAAKDAKLEVAKAAEKEVSAVLEVAKTLDRLKGKDVFVLDLKLLKDGQAIQPGEKIKVTLPLFDDLKEAKFVSVHRLSDDGKTLTFLGSVEVKDGKFTFETDHFSTYVFAAAEKAEAAEDETIASTETEATTGTDAKTDEGKKTGDAAPIVPIVVLAAVAVGAVVFVSSKKRA
jgi:hypothetical protein